MFEFWKKKLLHHWRTWCSGNDKVWITRAVNLICERITLVCESVNFICRRVKRVDLARRTCISQGNVLSQRGEHRLSGKVTTASSTTASFFFVPFVFLCSRSFEFHWQRRISFSTLTSMWHPVGLAGFLLDQSLIQFRVAYSFD